jgi:hypothetical protein
MSEADQSVSPVVKKHKRGDVREDGWVFNNYYKQKGKTYEYWVSREKFEANKKKAAVVSRERYRNMPIDLKKEANRKAHLTFKKNPERIEKQRLARMAWQKRNKDYLNAKHKEKRDNNPIFALAHRIRRMTAFAFTRKGFKKDGFSEKILGCSWEHLKAHIEGQFLPGMSWENRGEWHVDHKIPLASAKTPEEVEELCKWHNLQPLWKEDNLKKGAKLLNTSPDAPEST